MPKQIVLSLAPEMKFDSEEPLDSPYIVHSEPASSSHEQPQLPQLPFHGPNSPASEETEVEDEEEELIPDQPEPTPQTLCPEALPGDGWKWWASTRRGRRWKNSSAQRTGWEGLQARGDATAEGDHEEGAPSGRVLGRLEAVHAGEAAQRKKRQTGGRGRRGSILIPQFTYLKMKLMLVTKAFKGLSDAAHPFRLPECLFETLQPGKSRQNRALEHSSSGEGSAAFTIARCSSMANDPPGRRAAQRTIAGGEGRHRG